MIACYINFLVYTFQLSILMIHFQ